jgi:peptidoglycan hydrolase-like protein with peptidoglycan-binding domain
MLAELNLLYRMRHQTVFVDVQDYRLADPKGTYGQATTAAVAAFQQQTSVGSQPGICDQATYDALAAEVSGQAGNRGQSMGMADAASAVIVVL